VWYFPWYFQQNLKSMYILPSFSFWTLLNVIKIQCLIVTFFSTGWWTGSKNWVELNLVRTEIYCLLFLHVFSITASGYIS
jgi:hypothetical protein